MLLAIVLGLLAPQQPPAAAPHTVSLTPQPVDSRGPRWSPKGATVPLTRTDGALCGSFPLGHAGAPPVAVRLQRSDGAARFDQLWIDLDRNGALGDDERLVTEPRELRGKWWSSFTATLAVPLAGERSGTRPYPISLWFVADPEAPDAPPALRWSRRGFCLGQVEIAGRPAFVLLTELHQDGVFDQRDAWAIARDRDALAAAACRSLEQHAWLDGVAFRATAIDPDGASLTFAAFDPGCTEAEEQARADIHAADRDAPRAAAPVPFGRDLAAALATARQQGRRVFVDFQTTWCGPCRQMEQWVYTAQAVVDAARDVVPVVLDGDAQRELVRRYQVTAYPTMLLLDGSGTELHRAVGYRGVAAMVEFLGQGRQMPERATYLITVADDFVVEVHHNGVRVPDQQRELLAEIFGATVERVTLRVRKGDWLVFHVVNNRLRWGGCKFFAVAGCAAPDEFAFESDPQSPAWSACDDPSLAARFIAERDAGTEVRARPIARPWDQGPILLRNHAGGRCTAQPVWGGAPSTWIKYVVE